jgi:hypothetical protein
LNPLFGLPWAQSTLVLITLDRHAEAIEEVRRARGIAGDSPNLTYREALARVLSGDLDTAVSLLSTGIFTVEVDAKACRAVARALEGREVEARRLAAEVEAQISHYEELLWVYHQLGDEEEVARLAREIDAEPLGPQQLLISLSMHGSRMLFSLDDAPNFRARLAEMGLDASRFQPMPRFAVTDEGTGK